MKNETIYGFRAYVGNDLCYGNWLCCDATGVPSAKDRGLQPLEQIPVYYAMFRGDGKVTLWEILLLLVGQGWMRMEHTGIRMG